MPLYIPWLTETIKKRGVRYLLHHYLGQFFLEKLTLEQLSVDIYEGKGSIRNLALDVDGLNDELDFIPFKFLDGCSIEQISVEVPWSSLATEACKVELEGAKFVCRLKTSADASKAHCTESTLLSRSLMTSSMQMAEDIVTTEDDDEYESPNSSIYKHQNVQQTQSRRKDANQMFEGLEMFAQLIDSVLRRTKLTARNTLFQIQPHPDEDYEDYTDDTKSSSQHKSFASTDCNRSTSGDEFCEQAGNSDCEDGQANHSEGTVEFFIEFFRCEEIIDESKSDFDGIPHNRSNDEGNIKQPLSAMPETVTKLLTLEDVEMRIGGVPVSNLIGKHTIMIKFNGQKSEISIFSGSPLLAVINHEQLKTFFNVFDSASDRDNEFSQSCEKNQKVMSPEDYAKIENQLLESACIRIAHQDHVGEFGFVGSNNVSSQAGRRWVDSGELYTNISRQAGGSEYNYQAPNLSSDTCLEGRRSIEPEPSLDNIQAFSCELKLPGIWLCILRHGEALPPLIKPYADSINSFQTINKYIDGCIKVPHIRLLALKVALDITASGIYVFLGDLDISEHLQDDSMSPTLHLLHNDLINFPMNSSRYKARIVNSRDITIDLLAKTRLLLDPTMIDRIVFDYKLIDFNRHKANADQTRNQYNSQTELNLVIRGEQFKVELLCPIPDLTPEAHLKPAQLRPQSFLFDFRNVSIAWQSDKLNVSVKDLIAYVKTQPQQNDSESIKFIEATSKNNDKIVLILEPSPTNLDTVFPSDIETALNESSMQDSIYVGRSAENRMPTEAFQTKRKVVRASSQSNSSSGGKQKSGKVNECDNEKILTPGDRKHLLDYLNQTVASTKLSLIMHLPICEVEFEDKEQLDLIYNRFGNDFVFWQPKASSISKDNLRNQDDKLKLDKRGHRRDLTSESPSDESQVPHFKQPMQDDYCSSTSEDQDSEVSFHSLSIEGSGSYFYDNEVTCKITVDELFVKFNHQSCAAALKQEVSVENLLLGVVIDVNRKPGTMLSLVADNLELSTDSDVVLEGNSFGDKNSIFSLTAEIKRPTKALKDIKLAIQLTNGLFNDFKTDTYTRFWQSINVTDEPILGYIAPKIVTELHIDVLNTYLSIVRAKARPALLAIDELYLTSMVMERTSQVMIRLIADEVSLYLKRNREGLEIMKNYICLVDSGLIDLDIKFSEDGRIEFGVINNVINVRACQDSLSALCELFNVMVRNSDNNKSSADLHNENASLSSTNFQEDQCPSGASQSRNTSFDGASLTDDHSTEKDKIAINQEKVNKFEMNLLEDAMNDYREEEEGEEDEDDDGGGNGNGDDEDDDDDDDDDHDEPELAGENSRTRREEFEGASSDEDNDTSLGIQQAAMNAHHRDPNACILDESNPSIGDLFSQPLLPTSSERMKDSAESFSSTMKSVEESGFFVIGDDDVGAGIIDKTQQEPIVRKLIDKPFSIIDNHFKMTKPRTIPEILVNSLQRYVLEEMTLVVNLYGGRDFDYESSTEDTSSTNATTSELDHCDVESLDHSANEGVRSRTGSMATLKSTSPSSKEHCSLDSTSGSLKNKRPNSRRKHLSEGSRTGGESHRGVLNNRSESPRLRFGEGAVNLWESLDLMSSPDFLGTRRPVQAPLSSETKLTGGTWRQTDVCMQLTLSKVKILYELGDLSGPISWRFMLFIQDIEIKDRIQASDINKMLYEYCTESMPRRNTQILTIKNVATINPSDGCEECDLKVSLKPLRLNIDQDTLLFLTEFFTAFRKSLAKQQQQQQQQQANCTANRARKESSSRASPNKSDSSVRSGTGSVASSRVGSQVAPSGEQAANVRRAALPISGGRPEPVAIRRRQSSERSETDTGSISFGSCSSAGSSSTAATAATTATATTATTSSSSAYLSAAAQARSLTEKKTSKTTTTTSSKTKTTTGKSPTATTTTITGTSTGLPTHCHSDSAAGSANQQPIYIKSFTFSPDVPIRLDYHAKHLDFEQGALAGILMGLAHLDHSELVLRRVQAKHGMRGLDRVLLFVLNSWLSDIKRNQLPSILSGVGPMHSVIQLFQGVRDLIWMPVDHYRRDRRLVRGLQRGASSFSSSTAMAAINLMNRFISIVQCTAQIAHDIVTPPAFQSNLSFVGPSSLQSNSSRRRQYKLSGGGCGGGGGGGGGSSSAAGRHRRLRRHTSGYDYDEENDHDLHDDNLATNGSGQRRRQRLIGSGIACSSGATISSSSPITALNQPRNFYEGVAVGFTILKEGFNDTARNVAVGMRSDDMRGTVGELVRTIPFTLLNPIISATEGAQNVLVGIRNQIAPDSRRDDQEKWKRRVRGK